MGSNSQPIIISWFRWHFFEMPAVLLSVWKNYLVFCADYFSIPLLLKTLFAPWHKTAGRYSKQFIISEWAGNIIFNIFSRVLGAAVRLGLILVGLMAQMLVVAAGIISLASWVLLPFIVAALIFFIIYV